MQDLELYGGEEQVWPAEDVRCDDVWWVSHGVSKTVWFISTSSNIAMKALEIGIYVASDMLSVDWN